MKLLKYILLQLLLLAAVVNLLQAQQGSQASTKFEAVDQAIAQLAQDETIVGGELLVMHGGQPVLHTAHGWRDRDEAVPMQPATVFCVRSMTKPVIGAAILMLIEEGKVSLTDRIADFLPAYDVAPTDKLTIEHLLTHTSGYPFSLMIARTDAGIDNIHEVAQLGAGFELEFEPGSRFQYSDQNTDTLTAIIEVVTKQSAVEFVTKRILQPLGMTSTTCLLDVGHPLRDRAASKYMGGPQAWLRYWQPSQEDKLFPCFLGSQGLYSTTSDYAKFMTMWQEGGLAADGTRLLSAESVELALSSGGFALGSPTGFPDAQAGYGKQMQLWEKKGNNDSPGARSSVFAFGHTGSDGTHAWVFPEQDIQVYYFTQSRGTLSGFAIEELLASAVLGVATKQVQRNDRPDDYIGYYWEGENDKYRGIIRSGDGIALEVPGEGIVELNYQGDDQWRFAPNPSVVIAFQRDAEGQVSGYKIDDHEEYKFNPLSDLPRLEEVTARLQQQHGIAGIAMHGPVRLHGKVEMPKLGLEGEFDITYAWPNQYLIDFRLATERERIAFDGSQATTATSMTKARVLEGLQAETARTDHHLARFGDWNEWFNGDVEVVQRMQRGNNDLLLIRAGGLQLGAVTFYVDMTTGRLVGQDRVTMVDGAGMLGQKARFDDFREIAEGTGIVLPFRTRLQYASPMLGMITSTVEQVGLGEAVEAVEFVIRDNREM